MSDDHWLQITEPDYAFNEVVFDSDIEEYIMLDDAITKGLFARQEGVNDRFPVESFSVSEVMSENEFDSLPENEKTLIISSQDYIFARQQGERVLCRIITEDMWDSFSDDWRYRHYTFKAINQVKCHIANVDDLKVWLIDQHRLGDSVLSKKEEVFYAFRSCVKDMAFMSQQSKKDLLILRSMRMKEFEVLCAFDYNLKSDFVETHLIHENEKDEDYEDNAIPIVTVKLDEHVVTNADKLIESLARENPPDWIDVNRLGSFLPDEIVFPVRRKLLIQYNPIKLSRALQDYRSSSIH